MRQDRTFLLKRFWPQGQRRLSLKYAVLMIMVMGAVLGLNGSFNAWLAFEEQKRSLSQLQQQHAAAAAAKIETFMRQIEEALQWAADPPWPNATEEERRIDGLRLLRRVEAINELIFAGRDGRERLRLSRLSLNVAGSDVDLSPTEEFKGAVRDGAYFGRIYFNRGSEPHMRIAMAGKRSGAGVVIAEVNLKLIWDVVTGIRFGKEGFAYVVDQSGYLIAHPDISLVLKSTNMAGLAQVAAAIAPGSRVSTHTAQVAEDLAGRRVLTASTLVSNLGWAVIAELPLKEAYAPAFDRLWLALFVMMCGLGLTIVAAVMLANAMVKPIRALKAGAVRIGSGTLDHRIAITSDDELGQLGMQFNVMAVQLEASYADLERKVEERTQELAAANQSKARFMAAASHDLRQPLHALSLFVEQLRTEPEPGRRLTIMQRLGAAISNMNSQFDALLDMSRLDAGGVRPRIEAFAIGGLLARIETSFAAEAEGKGLRFEVQPCARWVRSDENLLERVLQNLVANAIRYTDTGSVRVTSEDVGSELQLSVSDTGVGIKPDQHREIFSEFYRVAGPGKLGGGSLGLGLSIVDRIAKLLGHRIDLQSEVGLGSTFRICVGTAPAGGLAREKGEPITPPMAGLGSGGVALVIDDDPLAADATAGCLEDWGFEVDIAGSSTEALSVAASRIVRPSIIIADYHLGDATGIQAISAIRTALATDIPAILVSADRSDHVVAAASAANLKLLTKPLLPMTLRAVASSLLIGRNTATATAAD